MTAMRLARSGGRGLAERGNDVIDHFLHQDAVVALAHHADHRLGAGRADQQPAMAVEPLFAGVDRRFDLGVVERLAAAAAGRSDDRLPTPDGGVFALPRAPAAPRQSRRRWWRSPTG